MIANPVEGRLARDPVTMSELPAAGLKVDDGDLYWTRLSLVGDVTLTADPIDPAPEAEAAPAAATPAETPSEAQAPTTAEEGN